MSVNRKIKRMFIVVFSFIFLLILILLVGYVKFNNTIKKEKTILFSSSSSAVNVTPADIKHLPELIKNYLVKTNILGSCKNCSITLKQKGKIRSAPEKKWMPFTAVQHMSWNHPGFIWKAKLFPVLVRDKYLNGRGEVKVNFSGIKNIEVSKGSTIDSGALLRYFGELAYYPQGFLDNRITWEEINSNTVKGTLMLKDITVSGTFYFNEEGWIYKFEARRYFGDSLQNFTGLVDNYREFNGIMIPSGMTAVWNLNEGDFEYFKATVTDYVVHIN